MAANTTKKFALLAAFPLLATLSGCSVLTGFSDAYTDFGCRGVNGEPSCKPISTVYEEQKEQWKVQSEFEKAKEGEAGSGAFQKISNPALDFDRREASPFRVPEVIARVWLPPVATSHGVITDWHYSYVKLNDSRWTDNARDKLIATGDKYKVVTPIVKAGNDEKEAQKEKLKTLPAFGFGNPAPTPL